MRRKAVYGIMLTLLLTSMIVNIQQVKTGSSEVELFYDDGSASTTQSSFTMVPDECPPSMMAVLFHSPWESTRLLAVKFYVNGQTDYGQNALGYPCKVHVMDVNMDDIFVLEVIPNYAGWFIVDLEVYSLTAPKDFFVGIELYQWVMVDDTGEYPVYQIVPCVTRDDDCFGNISSPCAGKSWYRHTDYGEQRWELITYTNYMIRAVVSSTLRADLNNDRIVDIRDITIVAMAFGTKLGDENWNIIADLNDDEVIDIRDVTIVALEFGKTV